MTRSEERRAAVWRGTTSPLWTPIQARPWTFFEERIQLAEGRFQRSGDVRPELHLRNTRHPTSTASFCTKDRPTEPVPDRPLAERPGRRTRSAYVHPVRVLAGQRGGRRVDAVKSTGGRRGRWLPINVGWNSSWKHRGRRTHVRPARFPDLWMWCKCPVRSRGCRTPMRQVARALCCRSDVGSARNRPTTHGRRFVIEAPTNGHSAAERLWLPTRTVPDSV